MNDCLLKIEKFFLKHILRRTYKRSGACNSCGKCCSHIYVSHAKHVIKDEKEFKKLRFLHPFYNDLTIIEKDDLGLVFACSNLDETTKKCTIHKKRYGICKRYPQEEIFKLGSGLLNTCGYKFTPIETFEEVMKKISD